jgi:tetratricopeptide (TPR) repeat protein
MVLATQQISDQGRRPAGAGAPRAIRAPFDPARPAGGGTPGPLLDRAQQRRAAGDLLGALRDLDACLADRPDYAAALVQRAWVLRDLGRVHAAAFDFDRAVALAPHDPDVLYNRALFHQESGDMSRAAVDWLQMETLRREAGAAVPAPPPPRPHRPLYNRPAHLQIPPAPPAPVEELYWRGIEYVEMGNPPAGIGALLQVLDYRPADPDVLYRLAWAWARAGDYGEALQWLGAALAIRPALAALADQEPAFAPCRLPEL